MNCRYDEVLTYLRNLFSYYSTSQPLENGCLTNTRGSDKLRGDDP